MAYLPLSTANLPDPVIDPAQGASPEDYFNTVLYSGTSNVNSITGVGFQPDFVWLKQRNSGQNHGLWDSIRGANNFLMSNATNDENTRTTDTLSSFDSDGFTLTAYTSDAFINYTGRSMVAWNWKANGSGVTNTDGSITSTVSANTTSGFSVVSYTGTGATATVGHGLGQKPDWIVIKRRDSASNWLTAHVGAGVTGDTISGYDESFMLYLDATNAKINNTTEAFALGDSSVFAISTAAIINASGGNYIAYCFSGVEGFSKFGSYVGNGSADGPFVYCGFRPAWVLVKSASVSPTDWLLYDTDRNTFNVVNSFLQPNTSSAEGTFALLDILSNGFKIRNTGANGSGETVIYAAFAENPFKYSLAR